MNQQELEKDAGFYIGFGIILTQRMVDRLGLKMDDQILMGSYVFDMSVPVQCKFFCFGAGGRFVTKTSPISKYKIVTRTTAECTAFCAFIRKVDPEDKMKLVSSLYHIDLTGAKAVLVRRPPDDEIATLHMKYRDFNRQKGYVVITGAQQRMARELRALDRRRWMEGGIEPPPDRKGGLGESLWRGPRTTSKGDQYMSDKECDDDDLFGDEEDSDGESDDDDDMTVDGGAAEIDETVAPPITKKLPKKRKCRNSKHPSSASAQPPLERVLTQMRAKTQRSLQRLLHTSEDERDPSFL